VVLLSLAVQQKYGLVAQVALTVVVVAVVTQLQLFLSARLYL
jgi:hypothetical protein